MKSYWNWVVVFLRWLWLEQVKQLFLVLECEASKVEVVGVVIVGKLEESQLALVLIPRC